MADQSDEQQQSESAQETRVGHSVVEEPSTQDEAPAPTPPPPSHEPPTGGSSPAEADRMAADQEDRYAEKPHLYALGAFAGAFVFAQVLKRITGGGDD